MSQPAPLATGQVPLFDVAVVIPTVGRPTLRRAVDSVYRQRFGGTVQVLIGVDGPALDPAVLADLRRATPPTQAVTVLTLGYSTAARRGGLYASACGGALRTVLSYAAHSRLVAYLDDDNWWAEDHLAGLVGAVGGRSWAYSLRWYVDAAGGEPLCVDEWESVGPGAGVYRNVYGGFVDPSCLLIDKLACADALPAWCEAMVGDPTGMSADRAVFQLLRHRPAGASGRATAFYTINPADAMHPRRLEWIALRGRPGGS